MAISGRPEANEYGPYYGKYIELVPENDICAAFEAQARETAELLAGISEERSEHRYQPEKWSIKQLVGHVSDAERIFAYRTLCIARGEKSSLPGFDETDYMRNSNFDQRSLASIVREYETGRQASIAMLRGFADDIWMNMGVANNQAMSVRAIAFTFLGHERHHLKILRERYIAT